MFKIFSQENLEQQLSEENKKIEEFGELICFILGYRKREGKWLIPVLYPRENRENSLCFISSAKNSKGDTLGEVYLSEFEDYITIFLRRTEVEVKIMKSELFARYQSLKERKQEIIITRIICTIFEDIDLDKKLHEISKLSSNTYSLFD